MRFVIDSVDETGKLKATEIEAVEELIQFAGNNLALEADSEVSISYVTNEEIRIINRDYRDKDAPTDVISFALEEESDEEVTIVWEDDQPQQRILGDIIISIDRAREQAESFGHSFEREIGFLALHGLLHLLGYDHMEPGEEKIMFDKQKNILEAYGLTRD